MPILNLTICVCSSENIAGLVMLVFGSPGNVRKWNFVLVADGCGNALILDVEDLNCAVVAG